MLTRVYIDNFKSLVDFEFRPGPIQLILGDNGSGKSSFCEAIRCLRGFLVYAPPASQVFHPTTLTRWDDRPRQVFELTVEHDEHRYVYRVEIEQPRDHGTTQVASETLYLDGSPLFTFIEGEVQRYCDDRSKGPGYSSDQQRSALSSVPPDGHNEKLTWFKGWMRSLCLSSVSSQTMGWCPREEPEPDRFLINFISWYLHMQAADPAAVKQLQDVLREGVIEGFDSLVLVNMSKSAWRLDVRLKSGSGGDATTAIPFDSTELSDGQLVLIKLYALAFWAMKPGSTLILDDPVVHVSLREIQPWLTTLIDRADDIGSQVLLISHHPEIINYLARESGVVFSRDGNGPVHVRPARFDDDPGLTPAEEIARGWADG